MSRPQSNVDASTPDRVKIPDSVPAPMTATLMGRLFMVPALVVCLLLGVTIVVVLFGTTSLEKQASTADLLATIEADTGERTMGSMLMPRAKESWQAAQELARRFDRRDAYLKPDEIEPTAERIIGILAKFGPGRDVDKPGPMQEHFLMLALARLKTPSAVQPLSRSLKDANGWTRKTALEALATMSGVPQARRAVADVLPLLEDKLPEVQIVACAALASLAEPGDRNAIRALVGRLSADREIQWNAAMTLARLGSAEGKLVLLNMLDRSYWEGLDLAYTEDGIAVKRKLTDNEVAANLEAAVAAACRLHDADLAAMIGRLERDKAPSVREAARRGGPASRSEARRGDRIESGPRPGRTI